jgi:hypothetical protein
MFITKSKIPIRYEEEYIQVLTKSTNAEAMISRIFILYQQ